MKISKMKLSVVNPNLSVILPVGCNAKCDFCYWSPDFGLTTDRFEFISKTLPEAFNQVSITGGEPTLHPLLIDYLNIARNRFDKIVLNTNGYKLTPKIANMVNHVNISRHHFSDEENNKIFNTIDIPTALDIKLLLKLTNNITLNCVLPDNFNNKEFIII